MSFCYKKYIFVHFNESHCYDKKDLKPQDFADDKWHKEDVELFVDPTDILVASKSIPEFYSIPCKTYETYPYLDKSCGLSAFSNILNLVQDKEDSKKDNNNSEDQLK